MRSKTLVSAAAVAMAVAIGPALAGEGSTAFSTMAAVPSATPMTAQQLDKTVGGDFSLGFQVTANRFNALIQSDGNQANSLPHSLGSLGVIFTNPGKGQ